MTKSESTRDRYFTAIVHAADGVRFVASSRNARALAAQVAGYVRERCDDTLWPTVAAEVKTLIEKNKLEAAIATYFANVGQRWDVEQLELGGVLGA